MAARHFLLHCLRLRSFQGFQVAPPQGHRLWCSATLSSEEEAIENASGGTHTRCSDVEVDEREWMDKEEKIARDIEPIVKLTRHILFSPRYKNGELLTMEDERAITENVLIYHPEYEDKIGSGLFAIMVDRHPVYLFPRCLFVVRTDCSWIDFSYRVCLEEYIKNKYQIRAERFVNRRFLKNLIKRWGIGTYNY
ncbi:protein DCL homolog, chloroplastic [Vigna radiata var. radiata]|uniref:Protein DCL homolog, chloroplastic n=1 Tax=Vigna radiata var. radiata TaxID=3916 RepID=A0A1S3UDB4_VIGRR|nr:protein DCL homolog, chloroplastic [Vigna radiata var. radiata]